MQIKGCCLLVRMHITPARSRIISLLEEKFATRLLVPSRIIDSRRENASAAGVMCIPRCLLHCKAALCTVAFIFSLVVFPLESLGEPLNLDALVPQFDAKWGSELQKLCSTLNRPCGEELTSEYRAELNDTRNRPELHMQNASVKRILDTIIRLHPGHRWRVQDDVLIMEPQVHAGDDLLGRRLAYVSILGKSSYEASQAVLKQAGITPAEMYVGPPPLHARVSVSLKDVTVRDALTAIVKADGQVMWMFSLTANKDPVFEMATWRKTGIRRYESLENP